MIEKEPDRQLAQFVGGRGGTSASKNSESPGSSV